jgi:hypothetical protein
MNEPSDLWLCERQRHRGGLIRSNDGLISGVGLCATGSVQFICVVPLSHTHPNFLLLRTPSNEGTDVGDAIGNVRTCGYKGHFASPKRYRRIQAVMVSASMNAIAADWISSSKFGSARITSQNAADLAENDHGVATEG